MSPSLNKEKTSTNLNKDIYKMISNLIDKVPFKDKSPCGKGNKSPLNNHNNLVTLIQNIYKETQLGDKTFAEILKTLETFFNFKLNDCNSPVERAILIVCLFAYGISTGEVSQKFMEIAMKLNENDQRLITPLFEVLLDDSLSGEQLKTKLTSLLLPEKKVSEDSLIPEENQLNNSTIEEFMCSPAFTSRVQPAAQKILDDLSDETPAKLLANDDSESKIKRLQNENDDLQNDQRELNERLKESESKAARLTKEIAEMRKRFKDEIKDYEEQCALQASALAKFHESQEKFKEIQAEQKMLKLQIDELRNERASNEATIGRLEKKLEENEDVQYKNKRMADKITELEFLLGQLKDENENLKSTVKDLEEERARMREEQRRAQRIEVELIPADESEVTTSPVHFENLGFIPEKRLHELRQELDVIRSSWVPPNRHQQHLLHIQELEEALRRISIESERKYREAEVLWKNKNERISDEVAGLRSKLKTSCDHLKAYEEHVAVFKAHYNKKKDGWTKTETAYKTEIEELKRLVKEMELKVSSCGESDRIGQIIDQLAAAQKSSSSNRTSSTAAATNKNAPRVDLQQAYDIYRMEKYPREKRPMTADPIPQRNTFPVTVQPIRAMKPQLVNSVPKQQPSSPKLDLSPLMKSQKEFDRLADLMERNARCKPHLRSVYPTEEGISPGKEIVLRSGDSNQINALLKKASSLKTKDPPRPSNRGEQLRRM